MKKVYLFYLYDEQDKMNNKIYPAVNGLDIIKGNKYYHVLYAWTPNKEIRKRFKNLRDMTKFREVIHEIPKEDFDKFSDENSDTFLEDRVITTKSFNDKRVIIKRNVYILSTGKELDIMVDESIYIMRKRLECLVSSNIYLREAYFSNIYSEALNFFKLDNVMDYIYPLEENDIPFNMLDEDKLAIYSHLYHNTYRKDIDEI